MPTYGVGPFFGEAALGGEGFVVAAGGAAEAGEGFFG